MIGKEGKAGILNIMVLTSLKLVNCTISTENASGCPKWEIDTNAQVCMRS